MYFNDIHILYYVFFILIGIIIGQLIDYCSKCFIKEKKIFSIESWKIYKKVMLPNYVIILTITTTYVALLYKFGIGNTIAKNISLIRYIILIPMLACAFYVDYKEQIIPNRLNLLIFETGLVFTFIEGFSNINIAKDMFFGMLAGGGIFLGITLIGGLIAGKEAMGFGDVKLMGALGLYFGLTNIIIISIMSFLIGAVVSVILLCIKNKKANQYMPFGPFIVVSSIICIFIPFSVLFNILMEIFTLGMY